MQLTGRLALLTVAAAAATVCLTFSTSKIANSTSMFAARSARTCDNCHVGPNDWVNPAISERKCTMSCVACHIDPSGGGMRNASGRYFGRSTLSMIATSPRPTADWDRNWPGVGRRDRATTYSDDLPLGPNSFEEMLAAGAPEPAEFGAWGSPLGSPSRYGLLPGRYHDLNADPMLRVGLDLRLAALLSGPLAFPMQVDVPVAFRPVRHVTFLVNTGARGRASGYSDTFDQDHSFYFREAFALFHEAPFQAYAKVGRFVPSFGLRLDDHTSSIRRSFELDGALPESRVTGVEIGAAPNYPFVNLSWFRMADRDRVPDAWDVTDVDDGWGAALNAGWRGLAWSVGGSALLRRRDPDDGGDATVFGVYGALNPWRHFPDLPLTYQVEMDYGELESSTGRKSNRLAFYQEANWVAYNGVTLLVAHDWRDPDREILEDEAHRLQGGVQISPISGLTFDGRVRVLLPAFGEGADADVFLQTHVWY